MWYLKKKFTAIYQKFLNSRFFLKLVVYFEKNPEGFNFRLNSDKNETKKKTRILKY